MSRSPLAAWRVRGAAGAERPSIVAPAPDASDELRAHVVQGLSAPARELSPKYFYDDAGAALFERICELDEYYLTRVESAIHRFGFGEAFVGVIVFAIIGNAAEHTTAVIMALRGRMGLAIGIALESSKQIAVFVTPLLVFAGLFVIPPGSKPMSLHFDLPEVVAMWASVQIVDVVIHLEPPPLKGEV